MKKTVNYSINLKDHNKLCTIWPISKWIFTVKMNSLLGSNLGGSVTICINSIIVPDRPNMAVTYALSLMASKNWQGCLHPKC